VYVAPSGCQRPRAPEPFITEAANIAAMAPETTIRRRASVAEGGDEIKGAMARRWKISPRPSRLRLAQQRGRNEI